MLSRASRWLRSFAVVDSPMPWKIQGEQEDHARAAIESPFVFFRGSLPELLDLGWLWPFEPRAG